MTGNGLNNETTNEDVNIMVSYWLVSHTSETVGEKTCLIEGKEAVVRASQSMCLCTTTSVIQTANEQLMKWKGNYG